MLRQTTLDKAKLRTKKAALPSRLFLIFSSVDAAFTSSARVELDDQVRFHLHRIGHVRQRRRAGEGGGRLAVVDVEIIGHVALGELGRLEHDGELAGALLHRDDVTRLDLVGGDVDALAVDRDVAVVDELTGGEDRRHELGTVDHGVQAPLEQADQVLARVALQADRLGVVAAELLLGDRAVVALELLLGAQLRAEVGRLALAALAVLAGAVFAAVDRGLRAAPDVLTEAAVNLVFRLMALRHIACPREFAS